MALPTYSTERHATVTRPSTGHSALHADLRAIAELLAHVIGDLQRYLEGGRFGDKTDTAAQLLHDAVRLMGGLDQDKIGRAVLNVWRVVIMLDSDAEFADFLSAASRHMAATGR